jgi:hypothetical protein
MRAFDYEHTFFKNGRITEKEATGATLKDDLNNLLWGRTTSIYVKRLII